MGICSSTESISIATAKLILQNGQLQEFSYPIKASYVLQKHPSHIVCNSDEMDFDSFVLALHADEDLKPGQLYFLLPLSYLKRPIMPDEMAALAVKASSALMKSGSINTREIGERNSRREGERDNISVVRSCDNGLVEKKRRSRTRSRGGSGSNFEVMLSAIPE
ncbi:hypothetical protein GIB67_007414 [Kingdonia uniflora]|uniref:Uncharacterized protein n=1 Tax=Kingdonia uniflora TaxID=39325 RepID=A0A7J7MLQ0_9MAGN|nr:hypothetical protein GIB67_007414 [Kingdonia uniflora]